MMDFIKKYIVNLIATRKLDKSKKQIEKEPFVIIYQSLLQFMIILETFFGLL